MRRFFHALAHQSRRHWAVAACVLIATSLAIVAPGPLGDYVDANITRPFYFKTREWLRKDPALHPQLKILSYDDGSVDRLQRPDLTIDDWATVLEGIARAKPRVILIDKVFSIIFDPLQKQSEALAKLQTLEAPVIVGAFAIERENKTRHPLDVTRPIYQAAGPMPIARNTFAGWHVYGPNPVLQTLFKGAGHLLYYDNGFVNAVLHPRDGVVVPHMSLFAGDTFAARADGIYVNGRPLPLNDRGQVVVNFSNENKYYDRHRRLGAAVLAARAGEPIKGIEAGDTVLILPEMFTGSTDFKVTPLGIMPGGFIIAAMVNSTLTSEWLRAMPGVSLQVLLLCLIGALWGRSMTSVLFWAGQTVAIVLVVVAGVVLFSYNRTAAPLLLPLLGGLACAYATFADRTWLREREARRVSAELKEAAEIAKAFLSDDLPQWNRMQIAAYHRAFTEASGDWFAFREAPSGKLQHFVLADITGHGVQAALMVSVAKTMLAVATKDTPERLENPEFVLQYARDLNAMLCHHGKGQHLLTLLGLTFDPENRLVHYVSAGHPPPLLFSLNNQGERRFSQLVVRSTVLGLTDTLNLKLHTYPLQSGEEIVTYTDGLPLGRHVRAVNQFFTDRAFTFEEGPRALLDAVWDSETRRTGRTLDDDVSIVWFKAA